MRPRFPAALALILVLVATWRCGAETDYSGAIPRLRDHVREEMKEWGIGGVAFALTDGTRVVHAEGLGEAKVDSVFRAGSISKVFTALLVMKWVEAGRLSLDAPVAGYPGAVLPHQPFRDAPAIQLRHLLTHRSGLPRETPVGGYLDGTEPGFDATCESLARCVLATPPGAKMRYSNIAPSIAGRIAAAVTGASFEAAHREHILAPLGMTRSTWTRTHLPPGALIVSRMRVADLDGLGGFHREESPVFDLGTLPAGNLFTTAPDLAQLLLMMSRAVRGETGILKPETLAEMWRPQWEPSAGFGLGFALGKFRGHRTVGHNGAVYGHSALLLFLPETQLGIVFLANEDIVNARVGRWGNVALSLMIEAKTGERAPAVSSAPGGRVAGASTGSQPGSQTALLAGRYESQSFWMELISGTNDLYGSYSGQPCRLTATTEGKWVLNSRLHDDQAVGVQFDTEGRATGFTVGTQNFQRVNAEVPAFPPEWKRFCGVYGSTFIPVIVHEKFGHLYAMTENMVDYRLTPVARHVFALPPGMYVDELAVFLCDAEGRAHSVDFASMTFSRRR